MKIAVTTEGNEIFQHFGQCKTFSVYSVQDGKVQGMTLLDTAQHGHSALADFLTNAGVNVVICGGIGDGAKRMLSQAGIQLLSGIDGSIDSAVQSYLAGSLSDNGGRCSHHDHEEEHSCSCGHD